MKKWILFILLIPIGLHAQFTDNFSDGNFTNNPVWSGDIASWTIDNNVLRSNDNTASNKFYLSTPSSQVTNVQWEFLDTLLFSTSSANYVDVYLTSDSGNLKATNFNGYFVRIGNTKDEICLYKRTGSTSSMIIDGIDGITNSSKNVMKIKVTRDINNLWTLQRDLTGKGSTYFTEGTVTDASILTGSYFGIFVVQSTSSFFNKHYFDDFYVGPIIKDTLPPSVTNVTVLTKDSLNVYFNEIVDQTSAELLSNYSVNNGIGSPQTAKIDITDKKMVHLTFTNLFQNGTQNILTINNVKDFSGNAMTISKQITFTYYLFSKPVKNDVVINEIYSAPTSDNLNLPNAEFVELLNTSSKVFNLNGWKFKDNSTTTGTFPDVVLTPGEYLIICSKSDTDKFSPFGKVAGLSSLPALNNDGDLLKLYTSSDTLVNSVQYSDSWYKNSDKKSGGWSLEQINPLSPCSGADNWIASTDSKQGTPGKQNSVYSNLPDTKPPSLTNVYIYSGTEIQLVFDEGIDVSSISSALYNLNSTTITPVARPDSFNSNILILTLNSKLIDKTSNTITITNIRDCWGNLIAGNNSKVFFYYDFYPAKPGDIVINELMPDPDPPKELPNAEYIELYNRTNNAINLKGFTIWDNTSKVTISSGYIVPKGYAVLCNTSLVSEFGPIINAIGTSMSSSMLNNTGELIILKNDSGIIISQIGYTLSWYANPSKDDGGWSLEQIDPENPCSRAANWRASENATGGTPGSKNSVFANNPDTKEPELIKINIVSADTLQLIFSETMDSISLYSGKYYINDTLSVASKKPLSPDYTKVNLVLNKKIVLKKNYTITINDIRDCSGNTIKIKNKAFFGLPEKGDSSDIVLNEILFNPKTGGNDFVELYNKSDKYIDLRNWQLANKTKDTISDKTIISTDYYTIYPKQYVVVTMEKDLLKKFYSNTVDSVIIDIPSLPSYNDDKGIVIFLNPVGKLMDRFDYSDKMHFSLLRDKNGVSLERVSIDKPANEPGNWQSAATTSGYATPGAKNSQVGERISDEEFAVLPRVFTPDSDGKNDFATVIYNLDKPGYVGTLTIFDSMGRKVKKVAQNEYLGQSGNFSWDGSNEDNLKARVGYYIVYFEVFDMNGKKKDYKETVVVGAKF